MAVRLPVAIIERSVQIGPTGNLGGGKSLRHTGVVDPRSYTTRYTHSVTSAHHIFSRSPGRTADPQSIEQRSFQLPKYLVSRVCVYRALPPTRSPLSRDKQSSSHGNSEMKSSKLCRFCMKRGRAHSRKPVWCHDNRVGRVASRRRVSRLHVRKKVTPQ